MTIWRKILYHSLHRLFSDIEKEQRGNPTQWRHTRMYLVILCLASFLDWWLSVFNVRIYVNVVFTSMFQVIICERVGDDNSAGTCPR